MGEALLGGGWSPNYLTTSFFNVNTLTRASQVVLVVKNLPTNAGDTGDTGLVPGGGHEKPLLVFFPGESHGQRSLVDYSPWDCKELDTTEHTCTHSHSSQPEIQTLA